MKKLFNIFTLIFLLLMSFHISAQTAKTALTTTRILFLLDGSASMSNSFGDETRMDAAKKILGEIVDSLKTNPDIDIALRVYGHQYASVLNDCSDTKLEVPFGKVNLPYLKSILSKIQPNGITPIALSLEKAAEDFPSDPTARNIIILITDGEESCGGDPCSVSLAMQKNGVYLKPFVIGLGLDESFTSHMDCMGSYFNAQNEEAFRSVLKLIITKVMTSTTVQVNLLDENGKPLETDADMTFYDAFSSITKYDYYHTLTYRGTPDTISIDPIYDYDLTIHTTPEIEVNDIHLNENTSTNINVKAPQGYLQIELSSGTVYNNIHQKIKCLVNEAGQPGTVLVQNINTTEKFLTGKYDLTFLTLPRTIIPNVDVSQSHTTTIQIPAPGLLTVVHNLQGYGAIFITTSNGLEKIYELKENPGSEMIALQPGTYRLVYKSKFAKKSIDTIDKTFTITSGQNSTITL